MPNKERISKSESMALSVIRVFAMALIVSCHIAQCYELQIAWLLNVGVQIFFFMSGFLYGRLDTPASPFDFYKKRFIKVYIPFLIWVALIVGVYAVFGLYRPSLKQIVLYLFNLQWFSTPIEGLNHLWFLTVLMVGYLLTPWVKRLHKILPIVCISVFVVLCTVEFVFIKKFYSFFAWIALYFAGMMYGRYYSKKTSSWVLVVSAVFLIILAVLFKPDWLTQTDYRYHTIWLHWVLGVFLFTLLYRTLPHLIKPEKNFAVVVHYDKISYEVYLTHHPLILGPLSMLFITRYSLINVILMLIAVYILSRFLHYISSFVQKLL